MLEISVYMSFPARGGGKSVGVCVYVCIYVKKADTYRHAFKKKIVFHCLVSILQRWVVGNSCFRKKNL